MTTMKNKKVMPVRIVPPKPFPKLSMKYEIIRLFVEVIFMTTGVLVGVEGFIAQFSNRNLQTAIVYYVIAFILLGLSRFSYRIGYPRR